MKRLKTIDFPGASYQTPADKFSVLFLVAGHEASKIFSIAVDAWTSVLAIPPLDQAKGGPGTKRAFGAYCDTDPIVIDFQRDGKRLVVPETQRSRVLDRIKLREVPPLDPSVSHATFDWPAQRLWSPIGRFGDHGSLVVVLVKGNAEGELYQLSPSPEFPIPFVAVTMFGDQWPKVIARAIAQVMAFLADEYELPNNENLRPPHPFKLDRRCPNVILLNDSQRALLIGGKPLHWIVGPGAARGWTKYGWTIKKDQALVFHEHPSQGASPDDTPRKATGKIQLVEGGAGYRLQALRSDFDCLLRRKPYSTQLPIQDKEAQFCLVCFHNLRSYVTMKPADSLGFEKARILLDSQRPLTDTVHWKEVVKQQKPVPGQSRHERLDGPKGGNWEFKLSVDDALGLKITEVKLRDLPGVIYGPSMNILSRIGFRDLCVKLAGETPRTLTFADAFANTKSPPKLEVLDKAGTPGYLRSYRLSLTWAIPDRWDIEAVMSFVFKDVNNDFDPGGAVNAVKCYPQLSMRYRRPASPAKVKLPKVEYLEGAIELVPNNVIPPGSLPATLPHHLRHMATGTQSVGLFTDSNASPWDSEWDWDRLDLAEFANDVFGGATPPYGIWSADWRSGRLPAEVDGGSITAPSILIGSTARAAHIDHEQPTLPHWSWLFDYVQADVTGSRSLIGCYSAKNKTRGGVPVNQFRIAVYDWPKHADQNPQFVEGVPLALRDYTRIIEKNPRQGGFDNVHIHPDMGQDSDGRKIVAAPFCGDLCFHVHWRWGKVALYGSRRRENFLGWGHGRLDRGAHTVAGAPLIPPNQQLSVKLEKQTGQTVLRYEVRADDPDYDSYQVFLEQGVGIAFDYGGLDPALLGLLSVALTEVSPGNMQDEVDAHWALKKTNPSKYDETVRVRFHAFYPKIRFFNEATVKDNIQQSPEQGGNDTSLEDV